MSKLRLDLFLAQQGHFTSREKAKKAIADGLISINHEVVTISKFLVDETDLLEIQTPSESYVGRGAFKLKHALQEFQIDLKHAIVLDIGASTGGFTQVCLEHQAAEVYALDVGSNQLDISLRNDKRVIVMEHRNFRYAEKDWFPKPADFVCCDVSFISLKHMIPALSTASHDKTQYVLLIKPQFEAGKDYVNKHGVVQSKDIHKRVIMDVMEELKKHGITSLHLTQSPITGKDGNTEYLIHGAKSAPFVDIDVDKIVHSR